MHSAVGWEYRVPRENDPFERKMTVDLRIRILVSKYHCDRVSFRMGYAMPHDVVDIDYCTKFSI